MVVVIVISVTAFLYHSSPLDTRSRIRGLLTTTTFSYRLITLLAMSHRVNYKPFVFFFFRIETAVEVVWFTVSEGKNDESGTTELDWGWTGTEFTKNRSSDNDSLVTFILDALTREEIQNVNFHHSTGPLKSDSLNAHLGALDQKVIGLETDLGCQV